MDAQRAELLPQLPFFARGATGNDRDSRENEKAIEHAPATLHIAAQANASTNQSKATMGQQRNKVEKRRRRNAYNKRKQVAAKAKKQKKA
jgi:hypothetical protein